MKTVVGFFNRSAGTYPVPLITVVKDGDSHHAIFPNGNSVRLVDGEENDAPYEAFSAWRSFIKHDGVNQDSDTKNLMSFALSADEILIGSADYILSTVERESGNPSRSEQDRADLQEFVRNSARLGYNHP